ncbi:MAG: YafY family transcriptional regulator [Lachnospiraceae bacterium]|nr:YafY family transcriptional regulator [Lachnospiraceae bacterium]
MLNRLLGIIYILMNKGTVTASELAQRFEVSVRTIYRDVEALSLSGIPVYAKKGKNGGISLTEQFVLNKMLVSKEEQQQILAALTSIQETGAQEEKETLRKLGDFFKTDAYPWVSIDFSDWSGRSRELFLQLREAILNKKVLQFDYYGQYGEMTSRTVEPLQLVFKDYTWYLKGFCSLRKDVRLFKVLRMKRVRILQEVFGSSHFEEDEDGQCNKEKQSFEEGANRKGRPVDITLRIDSKEAYRVYDRFAEEEIERLANGDFQIRMNCFLDDWVYGLILSFGPAARVLEPYEVKEEMIKRIERMKKRYE